MKNQNTEDQEIHDRVVFLGDKKFAGQNAIRAAVYELRSIAKGLRVVCQYDLANDIIAIVDSIEYGLKEVVETDALELGDRIKETNEGTTQLFTAILDGAFAGTHKEDEK